ALDEEEMSAALLRIVSERREGDEIARLDLVRVGGDVESSRLAGLLRGEEIVPEVALREPAAERQKITTERLASRKLEDAFGVSVPDDDPAAVIGDDERDRNRAGQVLEESLLGVEAHLVLDVLGDVRDREERAEASIVARRRDRLAAEIEPNLAIAKRKVSWIERARRSGLDRLLRLVREPRDEIGCAGPELVEASPESFRARNPEEPLGRRIPDEDLKLGIDRDQRDGKVSLDERALEILDVSDLAAKALDVACADGLVRRFRRLRIEVRAELLVLETRDAELAFELDLLIVKRLALLLELADEGLELARLLGETFGSADRVRRRLERRSAFRKLLLELISRLAERLRLGLELAHPSRVGFALRPRLFELELEKEQTLVVSRIATALRVPRLRRCGSAQLGELGSREPFRFLELGRALGEQRFARGSLGAGPHFCLQPLVELPFAPADLLELGAK